MSTTYADTTLTIHLSHIQDNYRLLQKQLGHTICGAVVKANAYGLGAHEVAPALYASGCKHFFVATLDEAISLRAILHETHIYVFHGIGSKQEPIFKEYNLTPVLNTVEQMQRWHNVAVASQTSMPAILHIDTGMCRLGVNPDEVTSLPKLPGLNLQYIMSHLACADQPDHALNAQQLEAFDTACKHFPNIPASLCNSPGIFLGNAFHKQLARPGSALYGVNPTPGKANPMKSVVTLTSHIIQTRKITSPCTVGYSATHTMEKGSTIATVPVGYADGYLRHLSNNATCMIAGKEAPIVGRVSMDMITVDVTGIKCHAGSPVELLNDHITVDTLANYGETIGYEILTNLGKRYKRDYTTKGT